MSSPPADRPRRARGKRAAERPAQSRRLLGLRRGGRASSAGKGAGTAAPPRTAPQQVQPEPKQPEPSQPTPTPTSTAQANGTPSQRARARGLTLPTGPATAPWVPPRVPTIVPAGTPDTPWPGAFRRSVPPPTQPRPSRPEPAARTQAAPTQAPPTQQTPSPAAPTQESPAPEPRPEPKPKPQPEPEPKPKPEPVSGPAAGKRVVEPSVRPVSKWLLAGWLLLIVGGTAALVVAALELEASPPWIDGAGAVAVAVALAGLLASRTAGRAVIASLLAAGLGTAAVLVGGPVLPTGAAVMTCALGGVYAVMATVPSVTFAKAVRELVVATVISIVSALAALGFEPTVSAARFDFVALVVALALVFSVVYRLGAGLHGLGRRGSLLVGAGLAVLVVTLLYAELLHRYGAQGVVSSVLDFVDWTKGRIGAFPRPLVALLGIPAIVWGSFMRARRRQGWWVCAFGVAATVPMSTGLLPADASFLEAGLRVLYSLIIGVPLGYLVIRADLALSGPRGRRGRRVEEAEASRPEPSRFGEL